MKPKFPEPPLLKAIGSEPLYEIDDSSIKKQKHKVGSS